MKKFICVLFAALLLTSCSVPQNTCAGQRGNNPTPSAQGVYLVELLDQFGSLSGEMVLLQWQFNHAPHGAIAVCPDEKGFYHISNDQEPPCGVAIIHRQIELP